MKKQYFDEGKMVCVREERSNGYLTLSCKLVERDSWSHRGVYAYAQGTNDERSKGVYAWSIRADPGTVEAVECLALAKALAGIERKMEKWYDTYGRPATYGVYVQRFAQATRAGVVRFFAGGFATVRDGDYRDVTPSDAANMIDGMVIRWQEEGTPKALAEAS